MKNDGSQGDGAEVDRTLERMGLTVNDEERERLIRLLPRLVAIAKMLRDVPLGDAEIALHFSAGGTRPANSGASGERAASDE